MNRRIYREWVKCGGKGKKKLPLIQVSPKLFYLMTARNGRIAERINPD